jgi:hypothetical protein
MNTKKTFILLTHAFLIWAFCATIIIAGRAFATLDMTLTIHVLATPVIATAVSIVYFRFYHYTSPLQTAIIFLLFAMAMDAGLVAPFIEKSYQMFTSAWGTWIPFALIFIPTYITGMGMRAKSIYIFRYKI